MVNRASAEYNYDSWIVKVLRVRGTGVLKSSAHFTPGYSEYPVLYFMCTCRGMNIFGRQLNK
jgi:hypothetical protein